MLCFCLVCVDGTLLLRWRCRLFNRRQRCVGGGNVCGGCGVGRGSVITGLSAVATLAAAAASAVEEESTVCNSTGLSSRLSVEAFASVVLVAAVGQYL